MQGRKIVFRMSSLGKQGAVSSDEPTTGGNSEVSGGVHVSQSLKTTAAGKRPRTTGIHSIDPVSELVIYLNPKSENRDIPIPSVSEISTLASQSIKEVDRIKIRAIPERFQSMEEAGDASNEVYALIGEQRSAPTTPLHKARSLDKTSKHEHEDKTKHDDAFDEDLDALFILALELKELTRSFLPERDSTRLESKLQEYLVLLSKMKGNVRAESLTETERARREQPVLAEMWKAIDTGVHPDAYLLEQSDRLLKQAQHNVNCANIVERFQKTGRGLSKRHKSLSDIRE